MPKTFKGSIVAVKAHPTSSLPTFDHETAMATTDIDEKRAASLNSEQRIENVNAEKTSISSGGLEAQHVELDEAEANRVLRKVDYRLVPMLALLYLVAFIDRSNSESGFPRRACVFGY